MQRALDYMDLKPGMRVQDIRIDKVFIGSCTNGRIEDIREVARIAQGKKVASDVYAMVVPGSGLVKEQAESEGLDKILTEAGFDWREPSIRPFVHEPIKTLSMRMSCILMPGFRSI